MNRHHVLPGIIGKLLLACLLLASCGSPDSEKNPAAPAAAISSDAGSSELLAIQTSLDPALADTIELVSAQGLRPGRSNPVEAVITLRNRSAAPVSVMLDGQWLSAGGQGRGGAGSVLDIGAGQEARFQAVTRSADARSYRVSVKPARMDAQQMQAASLVAAAASGVAGHGVAYTDTPVLDEIPGWAPRGVANGAFFEAASLVFFPFESQWKLEIYDRPVDPMQGLAITRSQYPDVQSIHINLPGEPATGAVFERELAYGGGYFQIKKSPDATGTTSWNTSTAWVIEITRWDRGPWQVGGKTFQQAGTAAGRLYLCFKGSEGNIRSSFLAGVFDDAPIMYYGPPAI